MAGKMDAFDQAIKQIEIDNSSEINGDLKDYFAVSKREDDTYKIKWEKNISTHIRHKVTKLVKEYYVVEPVKAAVPEPVKEVLVPAKKVPKPVKKVVEPVKEVLEPAKKVPTVKKVVDPVKEVLKPVKATVKKTVKAK